MPTGSLPKEGKALWERVYDKALKGSCKEDKECSARTAWSAVKGAGWSKDKDGNWHKKSVLSQFSLAITRAAYDKATNRMSWRAVASDTDTDTFNDNMTLSLFEDFVDRIEKAELPPEKYRSTFWNGGNPYMSISHYPDLEGKAVPGITEKVYRDGNRLKAVGYFEDTPLGRACFRAICQDLYGENPNPDGKIRISIAFLDYSHRHKSTGYVFERGNPKEPICIECAKELLEESNTGLEFLKGHLIHLALTRVPANARTLIEATEVDKMAINTRKDDALSIVGEDEEAKSLVDEIAEESQMVGKSELVVKTEVEEVPASEPVLVEEAKKDKKDESGDESMDEEDDEDEKDKKDMKKSEVVDFAPILSELSEVKSLIAGLKVEPVTHPLDDLISNFKSSYDAAVSTVGSSEDKLATLQDPFNMFSQAIIERVRSTSPEEETQEEKSDVSVEDVTNAVLQKIGPQLEEIKSLIARSQPQIRTDGNTAPVDVGSLVNRRSLLPQNQTMQPTLQKAKSGLKSIREVVESTT